MLPFKIFSFDDIIRVYFMRRQLERRHFDILKFQNGKDSAFAEAAGWQIAFRHECNRVGGEERSHN